MQNQVKWIVALYAVGGFSSFHAIAAKADAAPEMSVMLIVAPLFVENAFLNSTVTMVNVWDVNDEADFELVSGDGVQLLKKHLVFKPRSQQVVQIGDLLNGAKLGYQTGSVLITQTTQPNAGSMGIAAQLSFSSTRGLPLAAEEEFSMASTNSTVLRGLTPARSAKPVIAVKNLSMDVRHITVECISEDHERKSQTFPLSPGHLLLVRQHEGDISFEPEVPTEWGEERGEGTGISVQSDGMPGDIAAYALTSSNQTLVGTTFADPLGRQSPDLVFVGVPVGSVNLLSRAPFEPRIDVANFGSTQSTVTVHLVRNNGVDLPGNLTSIRTVTLQPHTAEEISLAHVDGDPDLGTSFDISSTGKPGDFFARVVSTSQEGARLVDLDPKDLKQQQSGGGHPWRTSDDVTSTALFLNTTDHDVYYNVNINAGDIKWHKAYLTPAHQTVSLSINRLVKEQIADDSKEKQTLPLDTHDGTITWFTVSNEGIGRLLQTNRDGTLARSFSCSYYFVICTVAVTPSVDEILLYSTGELAATPGMCATQLANQCYGMSAGGTGSGFGYGWTSGNSGIAPVYGSANQANAQFEGSGPGAAGGTIQITQSRPGLPMCFASATGTNNVQVPTSLSGPTISPFVSYTNQNLYDCNSDFETANFYGIAACGQYTVLDQNGQQIQKAGLAFDEKLTLSDYNHTYAAPAAPKIGAGATDGNFHLLDFYSDGGTGAPLPGNYYLYYIQTITYHPTGSAVRVNCIEDLVTTITVANMSANPNWPCHH